MDFRRKEKLFPIEGRWKTLKNFLCLMGGKGRTQSMSLAQALGMHWLSRTSIMRRENLADSGTSFQGASKIPMKDVRGCDSPFVHFIHPIPVMEPLTHAAL